MATEGPETIKPSGEAPGLPDEKTRQDATEGAPSASDRATIDYRAAPIGDLLAIGPGPEADLAAAFQGRYTLGEKLGQGGFGAVYLGFDQRLNRAVAVKVSRPDRTTASTVDQLIGEARRVAQLQHPGIVTVHDVGVANGRCLIVSELLDGVGLDRWIRGPRPTWRQVAEIVAAVADALSHAHSRGIIHRDVKPSNILLLDGARPILVDFGLALSDQEVNYERGLILGTLAYMSPEQARGEAHQPDGRTDIYSLGVTLYEMLCGRLPFRGRHAEDLLRRLREDDPQPLRQIRPDIPPELERICLKALAREVSGRYTTAADMAEDLRRLCAGESTAVAPRSEAAPPPSRKSSDRPSRSTATAEPERRPITVLYCASGVGPDGEEPDDEHERFVASQQICRDLVQEHGGFALPATGQGFYACFGYPVALEGAPRQAVAAGLGIVKRAEEQGRNGGLGLTPRVAIHTGMAVVSEGPGETPAILGEVMTGVSRLEELFTTGEVLLSESTCRLVRGFFECERVGEVRPRGQSPALGVFRVVAENHARNRVEAADPEHLTPLIGRSREVELLEDRWEQAEERLGHVTLLIGDPGLGKSRLVHVMKEHLQSRNGPEGASVVEWYCTPHHQESPLYPAIDEFLRSFGLQGETDPGRRLSALIARLGEQGVADPERVALFASLLSIPYEGRLPPLNMSPDRQKERLLELLLEWLGLRAAGRPLLFIVEDLHWVDPSTRELLGQFVEQGGIEGVLAIFTARPEFEPSWKNKADQTRIALTRLTRRQVSEMMQAQTGASRIAPSLVDQIVDRTDGVPLFVEEFTKVLAEANAKWAAEAADGSSSSIKAVAIPATLQDLLMARLDRMSSIKEVVQLGAVLGRSFSFEMIRAVSELDEETLRVELDKLVEVGMLFAKGVAPRAAYTFKHALIQDAAYQSLVKKGRQQFHQRIAEAMERQFPEIPETKPELLAHHFTESGLIRRGLDYWLLAGQRSRERSAYVEALGQLGRGLELIRGLPPSADRDGLELSFRMLLGAACIAIRGYAAPEVEEHVHRARELSEGLGGAAPLFHVRMVIWAVRFIQGKIGLATSVSRELLDEAEAIDDDGHRTEAHWTAGCTAWWMGDFASAARHCEHAIGLYRVEPSVEHARYTTQNSGPLLLSYAALSHALMGDLDRARQRMAESLELIERLGHPFTNVVTLWQIGHMFQHLGNGPEALAWAEKVIALSHEQAFAFWVALGTGLKGAALSLQGDHAGAIPLLEDAIRRVEATGCEKVHQNYLGCLAEARWRVGRRPEAWEALDRAFAINDQDGERFVEAELHRRKALFLAEEAGGASEAAEASLSRAIEVARRQQARFFELRATVDLARLRLASGRLDDVRAPLRAICEGFDERSDAPDLLRARELLRVMG